MLPKLLQNFVRRSLFNRSNELKLEQSFPSLGQNGPVVFELPGLLRGKLVILVKRHLKIEALPFVNVLQMFAGDE